MALSDLSLIDKIDHGLFLYYQHLNRNDYKNEDDIGKFKQFANETGMDDDDMIRDELRQEGDDCTLIEFDNTFPFDPQTHIQPNEQNEEIVRILRIIAKAGKYEAKKKKYTLNVNMCIGISEEEINKVREKYHSQMSSIMSTVDKEDKILMYFFAVGNKAGFPFLTYCIDSYTKDKAKKYANDGQVMDLNQWAQKSKLMNVLSKAGELKQAMATYIHRIMNRLQFTPTYKICDSLEGIVEYIVSTAVFLQKMLDTFHAIPPFQVDLIMAVKKVKSTVSSDESDQDNSNSNEEQDEKAYDNKLKKIMNESREMKLDANIDYIGDVRHKLKQYPLHFCVKHEEKEKEKTIETIARNLTQTYNDFTTVLDENKDKKYDFKKYPQHSRFCIFIDRRNGKQNEFIDDEITYFQPPDDCNRMQTDHVPEIGFEFIRKCLIPQKEKTNIGALDGLCGQLMTVMFHVEQRDEIRCYIVWNQQTMRFHGENITKILPNLFVDSKGNGDFIKGENVKKMEDRFDVIVNDDMFESFYQEVTVFA